MSAATSVTSTTSALKLSPSETPPREGPNLFPKLSRDLVASVGNFLKVSDIGFARRTCKQLAAGLANSKPWWAFGRDLRIADAGNYRISVVGGRLPRSSSDLNIGWCYDPHTGTIVTVRCAEDGSGHTLSTCSVDDCSKLTVLRSLDSAKKFHAKKLCAHGGGFVTVQLGPPIYLDADFYDDQVRLEVWDMTARKMTHYVEIAQEHGDITALIDPSSKSLFVVCYLGDADALLLRLFDLTALEGALKPKHTLEIAEQQMLGIEASLEEFSFDFSRNIFYGLVQDYHLIAIEFPSGKVLWHNKSSYSGNFDRAAFLQHEGTLFQRRSQDIVKLDASTGKIVSRYSINIGDFDAAETYIRIDDVSRCVFAAVCYNVSNKADACRIAAWNIDTGEQLTSFSVVFPQPFYVANLAFDVMARARLFVLSTTGDAGVYIFDFKGNLLQQINRSFPSSHLQEYDGTTSVMRTQFELDKARQKLLISGEERGRMPSGEGMRFFNMNGILRVVDYAPLQASPSAQPKETGAEPTAKRARTEEHKDSKDSKDEKRNG